MTPTFLVFSGMIIAGFLILVKMIISCNYRLSIGTWWVEICKNELVGDTTMPGSAGSKYGIINDEIPLKTSRDVKGSSMNDGDDQQTELKDILPVLNQLLQHHQVHQVDSK